MSTDYEDAEIDLEIMRAARKAIEAVMVRAFKQLKNQRNLSNPRTNSTDQEIASLLESVDEAFWEERKICESTIEEADAIEHRRYIADNRTHPGNC